MFYWTLGAVPELQDLPEDERTRLFSKYKWKAMRSPWPWLLGVPVLALLYLVGVHGGPGGLGLFGVMLSAFVAGTAFRHGQLVAMRSLLRREEHHPMSMTTKEEEEARRIAWFEGYVDRLRQGTVLAEREAGPCRCPCCHRRTLDE